MKILSGRVLIKKIEDPIDNNGFVLPRDDDELPEANIILVSDDVKDIVSEGDKVYYIESRERGKCYYKDEEHFIIPISNIVAVL